MEKKQGKEQEQESGLTLSLCGVSSIDLLAQILAVPGVDPSPEPAPGEGDRYEYRGRLGVGGMGVVDVVWDRDLMRELAVKRIRSELSSDRDHLRRFLREARVTAALDHANIVPVHDLGISETGEAYFTMKRLAGITLKDVIESLRSGEAGANERYPVRRRIRMLLPLCHGLASAHSMGVLHRDLKPANVMLAPHGETVIMDWGLADAVPSQSRTPVSHLFDRDEMRKPISGTPGYMSPEQARGEPLDERSDLYSLGVILHELVTLEHPYRAQGTPALPEEVARETRRPLHDIAPDLDTGLAAVIGKAIATDRAQRYPTADEFLDDLERVLDGLTPRAEVQASIIRRLWRFYTHRDPRFAQLIFRDIQLMVFGVGVFGFGVGALAGISPRWAWAAVIAGPLIHFPPVLKWLTRPRRGSLR